MHKCNTKTTSRSSFIGVMDGGGGGGGIDQAMKPQGINTNTIQAYILCSGLTGHKGQAYLYKK